MPDFKLVSDFQATGDQPQAIDPGVVRSKPVIKGTRVPVLVIVGS